MSGKPAPLRIDGRRLKFKMDENPISMPPNRGD